MIEKDLGILEGPVLVFGGPYSNAQALRAMHQEAKRLGIAAHNVICTGDIVAYCAEPQACIDIIRDWGIHVVQGNCEDSLASGAEDCGCGFDENSACDLASKQWFEYAMSKVSDDARNWMQSLPFRAHFRYQGRSICVIHGGYEQQNEFIFASSSKDVKHQQLQLAQAEIMIGGHCGLPFLQNLESGKAWLNAGVIGMPANDGTPDGWYLLLEPSENRDSMESNSAGKMVKASLHRLRYDFQGAAAAMRDNALTLGYETSLETGLWPNMDILPQTERDEVGQKRADSALLLPS